MPTAKSNQAKFNYGFRIKICLAFICSTLGICATAADFSVGMFRPWNGYAIPNGLWLPGDYDGDGRSDILHAVQGSDYANVWTSQGNGTYKVASFSPWRGYAIPNGEWLVGDYNGDGRSDILHAVQNTDYANVWMSTGNSTFNVTSFSPWKGYAIPNGLWLVGDYNGDGLSDILHAVQNTDYANIWFSQGDGTFKVKSFSPWKGYAIPNGLWLVGDYNGDGRSDILHAVQGTDYANVWTSKGDGTFKMTSFSPWKGYAIPNGEWLVGDYNGDGRSDILHAVQGTDYANVWLSKGNGSFTVSSFSPWRGYAIPNGLWRVGDYNGDGLSDILHGVQGSDYANVWLSNGNSTFSVKSFSPWQGYAIPNGLWLVTDFNDDGKSDIVHAVQNTDYVHPWTATPPAPALASGQVGLEGIEITQEVQDMGHNVILVADKPTYVRAYLAVSSAGNLNVTGKLTVKNAATGATTTLNSINNATLNPAQNGNLRVKRESLSASLNFQLPNGFSSAGVISVSLNSVSTARASVACNNCQTFKRSARFINSSNLRVRLIGLSYKTGTPPNQITNAPRALDFSLTKSWLGRAYPVATVLSTQTTTAANNVWPFDCNAANAQLAALRATEVANGTDGRTHYYGLVSDAGGFMRGCAAGIPNAPDPTVVASGPAGASWSGDTDGSYADWYGGHELGHTFGRKHPGFCGESADDITVFPFQNAGRIGHPDGNETGLDAGDASSAIALTDLPSDTTFDVMTYCALPQWLSPYTYQGVRSRLNLENPAFIANPGTSTRGAPFPAEAMLQKINLQAPMMTNALVWSNLPSDSVATPVRNAKAPSVLIGDKRQAAVVYGSKTIPAVEVIQDRPQLLKMVGTQEAVPQAQPEVIRGVPDRGLFALPKEAQTVSRTVSLSKGAYLSVVATINLTQKTGKFEYITPVAQGMRSNVEQNDAVQLRLYNNAGKLVAQQGVWLRESTDVEVGKDRTAILDALIAYPADATVIEIVMDNQVLDRREASQNKPVVSKLELLKPKVVTLKNTASSLDNLASSASTLRWAAADSDANELSYRVEVSTDGQKTWQVIAIGLKSNQLELTADQLKEFGNTKVFRVFASDGWHTSNPVYLK